MVASPNAVPASAVAPSTTAPSSVMADCVPNTPSRVTGCASTISIVPRFTSPLTASDPREMAHTVTSSSTIGSS